FQIDRAQNRCCRRTFGRHRPFHSRSRFPEPAPPMECRRWQPVENETQPQSCLLELQQTGRPRKSPGRSDAAPPGLRIEDRSRTTFIGRVAKRNKSAGLTLLGKSQARLPNSPADAKLETFPNPARRNYRIR